ncbi:MAG: hypothetical protein WCS37_21565 [Chloroflexota bacterium]
MQIRQDQATATSWRTIPQILAFRLAGGRSRSSDGNQLAHHPTDFGLPTRMWLWKTILAYLSAFS